MLMVVICLTVVGWGRMQALGRKVERDFYALLNREIKEKFGYGVDIADVRFSKLGRLDIAHLTIHNKTFFARCESVTIHYNMLNLFKRELGTLNYAFIKGGSFGLFKSDELINNINGTVLFDNSNIVVRELIGNVRQSGLELHLGGKLIELDRERPIVSARMDFKKPNPGSVGSIKISGSLYNPTVDGTFVFSEGGLATLEGGIEKDGRYGLRCKVDHVKIKGTDLLTTAILSWNQRGGPGDRIIQGTIQTRNSVVDLSPVEEITGAFSITQDTLSIDDLKWAHNYHLSVKAYFSDPPSVDAMLEISNADIAELNTVLLKHLSSGQHTNYGVLNGVITCKGPLSDIMTKGYIESFDGKLGKVEFEKAVIAFQGIGPVLFIEDAWLYKNQQNARLNGVVDLRLIGEKHYIKQAIQVEGGKSQLAWFNWDMKKNTEDDTLILRKPLNAETTFGFKQSLQNGTSSLQEGGNNLQFEYKVSASDRLKMELSDKDDFFGIERKYSF